MDNVIIAGRKFDVSPLKKEEQTGLWLEVLANFEPGKIDFHGQQLLLFNPKTDFKYTPLHLKKIAERIEAAKRLPVVFCFEHLLTYERDRLVEQGVYFVVSDKYAFLPTLIINRKSSNQKINRIFSPATQYLMLYHLQIKSIAGKTLKELEKVLPYKYKTISKSIQQLQYLGLISFEGDKEKRIATKFSPQELWKKIQPYLINPIKAVYYGCEPLDSGKQGGISALSHYSMLAPEDIPTKVVTTDEFKDLKRRDYPLFDFEDVQRLEVWKYPPLGEEGVVDRFSLYLTLKEDKDPRVEKELETMINDTQW